MLGLPAAADEAISAGSREIIVVLPDAYSLYSGSMDSSSPTTGEWEAFVADGPPQSGRGFGNALLAQAAAWSPDPKNPPLYLDRPYDENGELRPIVAGKWPAISPLVFVDQYVPDSAVLSRDLRRRRRSGQPDGDECAARGAADTARRRARLRAP